MRAPELWQVPVAPAALSHPKGRPEMEAAPLMTSESVWRERRVSLPSSWRRAPGFHGHGRINLFVEGSPGPILSVLLHTALLICSNMDTVVVQSLSCVRLFATPWIAVQQACLSAISRSLLKLTPIESVMPSNHLILCRLLLLLPSIFPSIRIFSNESAFPIRWPKYWSFSFSPPDEYSGLISFKIDWFDLLEVQDLSRVFSSATEIFQNL